MYIGQGKLLGAGKCNRVPHPRRSLERRTREFDFFSPLHMKEDRFRTR
jgi:hypothetical protein